MTMGTSWVWKPNDQFKSAGTLIRNLCRIVARNGNYLIGAGPDGQGEFDPAVYDRLKAIGAWLRVNGEAIYETRPLSPYESGDLAFTRKRDGTRYVLVLAKDDQAGLPESVTLPPELAAGAAEAVLLGHGKLERDATGALLIPAAVRAASAGGQAWAIRF